MIDTDYSAAERVKQLEADLMRMEKGPGGIMEMKQTISDKEQRIEELQSIIKEIISQIDQGGDTGKVFARDNCIVRARKAMG